MNFPPPREPDRDPVEIQDLSVLLIEDSEMDAELILLQLERGGYSVSQERIETAAQMQSALKGGPWDVIISDYSLPSFDAPAALSLLQKSGLDIPFIVVSGKIGEETAVSLMKAGAHDYLKKDSMARLSQVVRREMGEARVRREKIEAVEALRASEERFRTLTELLPVGVYLADPDGRYLYTNQKWQEMAGMTYEEAQGDGWLEAVHPDDSGRLLAAWREVVQSAGKMEIEFRFFSPAEKITEVVGLSNVICDERGNTIGYIGANIDITERKKADEELRKSEARLLESQRSAHIGSWELNVQSREFHYSQEIKRILGLDKDGVHLSLQNIMALVDHEDRDRVQEIVRGALEKSQPFDTDVKIQRGGETRYVNARAARVDEVDGQGEKMIGTLQDITSRKMAELENEKLMVEFRRQTQEREAVINISSNLRRAQSYKEMLPILAEESAQVAKADAGAVLLIEENRLEVAATSGLWNEFFGESYPVRNDNLWDVVHANQSIFTGKAEAIQIAGQLDVHIEKIVRDIEACSFIPIKAGETNIGLLVTGYREPQAYTKERIDLLTTIAEIAGNTIQRMRTMEILEQLVTNRTRELSTIYNVVSVLSESVDLEKALDMVLEQVLTAMGAKFALFFLLSEDGKRLQLTAEKGLAPDHRDAILSIPLEKTWEGWIIHQGEPLVIPNINLDDRMVAPMNFFRDGIYSYLGAPMHVRGKVTGVLGVIRRSKPFNVDDILLISAIVDHIGLIIENTKLHKRAGQLAIIEERARLARDLHDSATQTMYSAMLFTETSLKLAERGDTAALIPNLQRLSQLSQQALREMRLLVYELRPSVLEQDGLVAALRQRLAMVEKRVGIRERLVVEALPSLAPGVEMALYRITLEALNNVLKHADASEVAVEISSQDGWVFLKVSDNGVGFDGSDNGDRGGIGLSSMRERAGMYGGTLEIESVKNVGTQIKVKLPVMGDQKHSISLLEESLGTQPAAKRSTSSE